MRQAWAAGFLILLLSMGYSGWLVLHTTNPVSHPVPMSLAHAAMTNQQVTRDVLLSLCGSNTIGTLVAPGLAQEFMRSQGATEVSSKATRVDEFAVTGTFSGIRRRIMIQAHGSASAFSDLASGGCDIGMASRRVQNEEAERLSALGDMMSPISEHVIALGAVVVIVSPASPLTTLSKNNIRRIFTGEIRNWSELGFPSSSVKVYAPDAKSGVFESFKAMVLGAAPLAASVTRLSDNHELPARVSRDRSAIGIVRIAFRSEAKALAVTDEDDARTLAPGDETVRTEDYALSRRLYFYTLAHPREAIVNRFVAFALSKSGQQIVSASGFIPLDVITLDSKAPENAPAGYKQLTQGAQQLSLDFRFQAGKNVLDNKALPDLDRVTSFISDSNYAGRNTLILGFADNTGNRDADCQRSKQQAQVVADQLGQRGVQRTTVEGFCSDLPVASNKTPQGREKNRRVEIWVKTS